jgi:hypothetical protein
MEEVDAGVELRVSCQFFLKPRHPNLDEDL